jgi:hypothetical protein
MNTITKFLHPLGLTAATVAAGSLLIQSAPAQAVIVKNGDFELGATDWTRTGNTNTFDLSTIPALVPFRAALERIGAANNVATVGSISNPLSTVGIESWEQILSTVSGKKYDLSYVFGNYASIAGASNVAGSFEVKVNNTTLSTLTGADMLLNKYKQSFTGSGEDKLSFTFSGVAASAIDGISVDLAPVAQTVPEPFTIIGTLIGGSAAIRMRKKLRLSK